jgi:hypothetical protein
MRRASIGKRLKGGVWEQAWDSVRHKVQGQLLTNTNVGDLEIGGEDFASFIPSNYHSVQFIQSDLISFQDRMVGR